MKPSAASIFTLLVVMFFAHDRTLAQAPCWVPPASLVSWWTGDTDESDLYGVNNPSAVNAVTLVPAEVGDGFAFGAGGYIDIPHSATLAHQKFTWDAWVKPEGPGPNDDSTGSIILQQGIDNNDVSVSLNWRHNPDNRFAFYFGNVNSEVIYSQDKFAPGLFYFVAGTYDGTTFRLYVNGVLEGTYTETKIVPYSTDPWDIGSASPLSRSEGYPRTFNGIIDEVQAFQSALSQSAIQSIYSKDSIGGCKAPVVPTPASLTFAARAVGTTSSAKSITVVNNRNSAITMDGFSFAGADSEDFAESSTTCGSTLAGRKSCRVSVTFTPATTGTATAALNIADSAAGSPQTATLSGTGGTGKLTGFCYVPLPVGASCPGAYDPSQCVPGEPVIDPGSKRCGFLGGAVNVDLSRSCEFSVNGKPVYGLCQYKP